VSRVLFPENGTPLSKAVLHNGVPPHVFRRATNFYTKFAYSHVVVRKGQFLSFIVDTFIEYCFVFICPLSYRASIFMDSFLPILFRQHFVVCRHVPLTNQGVPRVEKVAGHWCKVMVTAQGNEIV
jgi:hypothetical protein